MLMGKQVYGIMHWRLQNGIESKMRSMTGCEFFRWCECLREYAKEGILFLPFCSWITRTYRQVDSSNCRKLHFGVFPTIKNTAGSVTCKVNQTYELLTFFSMCLTHPLQWLDLRLQERSGFASGMWAGGLRWTSWLAWISRLDVLGSLPLSSVGLPVLPVGHPLSGSVVHPEGLPPPSFPPHFGYFLPSLWTCHDWTLRYILPHSWACNALLEMYAYQEQSMRDIAALLYLR